MMPMVSPPRFTTVRWSKQQGRRGECNTTTAVFSLGRQLLTVGVWATRVRATPTPSRGLLFAEGCTASQGTVVLSTSGCDSGLSIILVATIYMPPLRYVPSPSHAKMQESGISLSHLSPPSTPPLNLTPKNVTRHTTVSDLFDNLLRLRQGAPLVCLIGARPRCVCPLPQPPAAPIRPEGVARFRLFLLLGREQRRGGGCFLGGSSSGVGCCDLSGGLGGRGGRGDAL